MRRAVLALLTPIVLLFSMPALAQTGAQSEARTGPAMDRMSSLEAEVAELKRLVADNERRIAALEARLAEMSGKPATEPPSGLDEGDGAAMPVAAEDPARTAPSGLDGAQARPAEDFAADLPPWARKATWKQLRLGMTEDEVVDLLGPPDSTREIGFSRRLIYKGEVPGKGFLKGVVKLTDGAVSDLDLPDF